MLVAGACFRDEEMRRSVATNTVGRGTCDVSGENDDLIELEFFYDFFDEALGLFVPDVNGSPLINVIQEDWNLFSSESYGVSILNHVCTDLGLSFSALSTVSYITDIKRRIYAWDSLKISVLKERRFFSGHEELDDFSYLIPQATLKKNTVLFRARILPKDETRLKRSEMGAPPPDKTTPGRANPLGISYLYLCGDEETTYSEVRAVQLDRLAIGRFLIKDDLPIVDFNAEVSLYLAYDMGNDLAIVVAGKKIISAIQKDMARPMRRYDSELEYIPTQLICEYCKVKGADGICFESTLHRGGKNYVLFDGNSAKCTKVVYREVKEIDIRV